MHKLFCPLAIIAALVGLLMYIFAQVAASADNKLFMKRTDSQWNMNAQVLLLFSLASSVIAMCKKNGN